VEGPAVEGDGAVRGADGQAVGVGQHHDVRHPPAAVLYGAAVLKVRGVPQPKPRGLHSSTFRLHMSTVCGIRWVHCVVLVTEMAQVDLGSPHFGLT